MTFDFRLDIYSSHEGILYCKPHFKELFKPKVVVEDEEPSKYLVNNIVLLYLFKTNKWIVIMLRKAYNKIIIILSKY